MLLRALHAQKRIVSTANNYPKLLKYTLNITKDFTKPSPFNYLKVVLILELNQRHNNIKKSAYLLHKISRFLLFYSHNIQLNIFSKTVVTFANIHNSLFIRHPTSIRSFCNKIISLNDTAQ